MKFNFKKNKMGNKSFSQINVTPFVDVMLVLLIVFMITAPLLTVGVKVDLPKTKASQLNQKGDPFSDDQQILDFLKTLPIDSPFKKDAEAATRWNNAFCLMAELGLRPTEVNKLIVKKDPTTKEFYWFCTYEKKGGGGTTEPRRIEPLPLLDSCLLYTSPSPRDTG